MNKKQQKQAQRAFREWVDRRTFVPGINDGRLFVEAFQAGKTIMMRTDGDGEALGVRILEGVPKG